MGRQVIMIHIGQAGLQIANALWELFSMEHGLNPCGNEINLLDGNDRQTLDYFYYESQVVGKYVPRTIMADLEPTVLDEIRTGAYRRLWNPASFINGKEDAANNFARGFYTRGKDILNSVLNAVRYQVDRCDNISAFHVVSSFSGGTGSGFTSLLLENLSDLYSKNFKFGLNIFPSPRISSAVVDPYNALLHTHATLEHLDCELLVDNESLYYQCMNNLNVTFPTFTNLNRVIAQITSSVFQCHNYYYCGSQHADTTELLTNLVPYPRIHFPLVSYAPFCSLNQIDHETHTTEQLTTATFSVENQTLATKIREHKYLSCALLYRGQFTPKEIFDAIAKMKCDRDIRFVDWCPTGFKVGINIVPPITIPGGDMAVRHRAVCNLAGNVGIKDTWRRVRCKYDLLFSKRAFVHWFVSEGMEEGEFKDAHDDLMVLEQDYDEISADSVVDDSHGNDRLPKSLKKRPMTPIKKKFAIEPSIKSNSKNSKTGKTFKNSEDGSAVSPPHKKDMTKSSLGSVLSDEIDNKIGEGDSQHDSPQSTNYRVSVSISANSTKGMINDSNINATPSRTEITKVPFTEIQTTKTSIDSGDMSIPKNIFDIVNSSNSKCVSRKPKLNRKMNTRRNRTKRYCVNYSNTSDSLINKFKSKEHLYDEFRRELSSFNTDKTNSCYCVDYTVNEFQESENSGHRNKSSNRDLTGNVHCNNHRYVYSRHPRQSCSEISYTSNSDDGDYQRRKLREQSKTYIKHRHYKNASTQGLSTLSNKCSSSENGSTINLDYSLHSKSSRCRSRNSSNRNNEHKPSMENRSSTRLRNREKLVEEAIKQLHSSAFTKEEALNFLQGLNSTSYKSDVSCKEDNCTKNTDRHKFVSVKSIPPLIPIHQGYLSRTQSVDLNPPSRSKSNQHLVCVSEKYLELPYSINVVRKSPNSLFKGSEKLYRSNLCFSEIQSVKCPPVKHSLSVETDKTRDKLTTTTTTSDNSYTSLYID